MPARVGVTLIRAAGPTRELWLLASVDQEMACVMLI